jgi:hypothetical protein
MSFTIKERMLYELPFALPGQHNLYHELSRTLCLSMMMLVFFFVMLINAFIRLPEGNICFDIFIIEDFLFS